MGDEIGTPGLGIMAHGVDQMLADKRSATSYQREKSLMNKQNAMNLSNAMTMPSIQAHGLRMAGFNPAMIAGAGTQPAPTVSKGSADMAQTFPLDVGAIAQLALLDAQRENVEAQTEKTKAETGNVAKTGENIEADTSEKVARTLLYPEQRENIKADTSLKGEQAKKLDAETQSIRNTNEVFTEENKGLALFGQTMAMDWQSTDWYKKLPSGTKMVIDEIANGNVPLSIGSMRALITSIDTDSKMNEMEKSNAENALALAVVEAQMKDPKVREALAKFPSDRRSQIRQETAKMLQETKSLKFEYDWNEERHEVYEHQDPDKLYLEYQKEPTLENAVKWLVASFNDKAGRIVDKVAPAAVLGRTAGEAAKSAPRSNSPKPGDKVFGDYTYDDLDNGRIPGVRRARHHGFPSQGSSGGVENMRR